MPINHIILDIESSEYWIKLLEYNKLSTNTELFSRRCRFTKNNTIESMINYTQISNQCYSQFF